MIEYTTPAERGAFWQRTIDPERFRADHNYIGFQAEYPYEAVVEHLLSWSWNDAWSLDALELIARLGEDEDFGCTTSRVRDLTVSRDLLDSIQELLFLDRCGVIGGRVLDIGAGYGRMAHRMSSLSADKYTVVSTDAIEMSQRFCRRYLAHRRVSAAHPVVRPEAVPAHGPYDLAMNIHSWPECSRSEIHYWLDLLAQQEVPQLFVRPDDREMTCSQDGQSFRPDIEARGYKVANHWCGPDCFPRDFYLFELT